jgi:hypothetical protein
MRCEICGVRKRPERKPSARIGKVIVYRYFNREDEDLGRSCPRCLAGDERQSSLLDPDRFE